MQNSHAPKSRQASDHLRQIWRWSFIWITLAAVVVGWLTPDLTDDRSVMFPNALAVLPLAVICGLGLALPLACLWVNFYGPRAYPRALFKLRFSRLITAFVVMALSPYCWIIGIPVSLGFAQMLAVRDLANGSYSIWHLLILTMLIAYPITVAIIRNVATKSARVMGFLGLLCGQHALAILTGRFFTI